MSIFAKNKFLSLTFFAILSSNLFADTVTFAQFQEAGKGGNFFSFVNSGSSAVFQSKNPVDGSSSVPVTFSLLGFAVNDLPADLEGPQAAHMSFYIKTTQHVVTSGNFFDQNLYATNPDGTPNYGVITFTRDTPDKELHKTNLLTVKFFAVGGGLDGIRKGQTATLSADNETNLGNGQVDYVQFSSDYLTFAAGSDENLALSFTSANPCFSTYKNVTAAKGGCTTSGTTLLSFLHNFTAAGTGTFASDPAPYSLFAIPEPASASLVLIGAPLTIWGLLRRRGSPKR